jgi:hypothetical protein
LLQGLINFLAIIFSQLVYDLEEEVPPVNGRAIKVSIRVQDWD